MQRQNRLLPKLKSNTFPAKVPTAWCNGTSCVRMVVTAANGVKSACLPVGSNKDLALIITAFFSMEKQQLLVFLPNRGCTNITSKCLKSGAVSVERRALCFFVRLVLRGIAHLDGNVHEAADLQGLGDQVADPGEIQRLE